MVIWSHLHSWLLQYLLIYLLFSPSTQLEMEEQNWNSYNFSSLQSWFTFTLLREELVNFSRPRCWWDFSWGLSFSFNQFSLSFYHTKVIIWGITLILKGFAVKICFNLTRMLGTWLKMFCYNFSKLHDFFEQFFFLRIRARNALEDDVAGDSGPWRICFQSSLQNQDTQLRNFNIKEIVLRLNTGVKRRSKCIGKLTKSGLPEALQAWRDSLFIDKMFEYFWNIITIYKNISIDLPFRRVMVIFKIWINNCDVRK